MPTTFVLDELYEKILHTDPVQPLLMHLRTFPLTMNIQMTALHLHYPTAVFYFFHENKTLFFVVKLNHQIQKNIQKQPLLLSLVIHLHFHIFVLLSCSAPEMPIFSLFFPYPDALHNLLQLFPVSILNYILFQE